MLVVFEKIDNTQNIFTTATVVVDIDLFEDTRSIRMTGLADYLEGKHEHFLINSITLVRIQAVDMAPLSLSIHKSSASILSFLSLPMSLQFTRRRRRRREGLRSLVLRLISHFCFFSRRKM